VSEHVHEERTTSIIMAFDYCPTAESAQVKGVMFDSADVAFSDILSTTLAVMENTIAVALLNTPGPVRDYVQTVWPGGKFDQSEATRFANMVANQVLVRTVMKRDYAMLAMFHTMGDDSSPSS
jgi:hypothetical protein